MSIVYFEGNEPCYGPKNPPQARLRVYRVSIVKQRIFDDQVKDNDSATIRYVRREAKFTGMMQLFQNGCPDSITAEFQIHDLELFSYFRQTGYAKILTLQQIVASLANQLANRIELQSNHALSCSNR